MPDGHYSTKRQLAQYLKDYQNQGTNFGAQLFHLIAKAQMDDENLNRLGNGFPEAVRFWSEWQASPNGEDFLEGILHG